ncbi:hypothetical protein ACIQUQ_05320 [Streptomyces sp. NPDC101118]|uniref:hypothetical protein n=1 Tax=Streptomyces sp. NPDC101118 TaxID=3366109 RepID=UPI00380C1B6F
MRPERARPRWTDLTARAFGCAAVLAAVSGSLGHDVPLLLLLLAPALAFTALAFKALGLDRGSARTVLLTAATLLATCTVLGALLLNGMAEG